MAWRGRRRMGVNVHRQGDARTTADFVKYCIVRDLHDFSLGDKPGLRAFHNRHLKSPVHRRRTVVRAFETFDEQCTSAVKAAVAEQKSTGGRFTMTVDCWKTKGRRTQQYMAMLLHFVTAEFEYRELCAGVLPIDKGKTAQAYAYDIQQMLSRVDVLLPDVYAVVSDHEQSLRKACRDALSLVSIGCQCHALQLPVKHVIPSIGARQNGARQAESAEAAPDGVQQSGARQDGAQQAAGGEAAPVDGDESETDSSSDSTSEDSSSESSPVVPSRRTGVGSVLARTDPERVRLTEALQPLADAIRQTVKWFLHHPNEYTSLEETARLMGLPMKSLTTECQTRWDTTLVSWSTYIHNLAAMRVSTHRKGAARQSR